MKSKRADKGKERGSMKEKAIVWKRIRKGKNRIRDEKNGIPLGTNIGTP